LISVVLVFSKRKEKTRTYTRNVYTLLGCMRHVRGVFIVLFPFSKDRPIASQNKKADRAGELNREWWTRREHAGR
jgi:hypothetical protein